MRRLTLIFAALLACVVPLSGQEPIEDRAQRLKAEDIPLLTEKANAGDLESQGLLWQAYRRGYGVPKDLAKGVPWLRKAAEQGSPRAQNELAELYRHGVGGLPQDPAEDFKWSLKAAEHGHLVAQLNVGVYYRDGIGVKQDLQQARFWLTKSAEGGFSHAQWALGKLYLEGTGVPPDRALAERWFTKALAQGHPGAMNFLARMHTGPTGVPSDPVLVFDLYRAAADRGSQFAQFELGNIYRAGYLGAPDYPQALAWYQRASSARYAPADLALGEMYEQGQGVPADFNQALSRYQRAAGFGVYRALLKLGEINRDGRNQPPDLVAAAMWFTIAGKMGGGEGQNAQQQLNARLSDAQRQMAAARTNTWIVEHPDAMRQQPGRFEFQEYTLAEYPTDWPKLPPSTPQDRAYALQLTRKLEQDPLSLDAAAGRAWLERWWWGIPDIEVRYCNFIDPPDHQPYQHSQILYYQIAFSEGAYILEQLAQPRDWPASYLAGMQGALRAYESILRQQPSDKSRWLDSLLEMRDRGDLPDAVRQLAADRGCK
ncbi:MAG: sel1 repeat family protein [Acidobacteriia bacterium]|nr:sel1 repeat family protein [Terriglobia bacterium]